MSAVTSPRGYAPEQGSTAWKVIEFLTTNPDEALSPSDVEAKFGKPRSQVHSILAKAISSGVLVRDEDIGSGDLLYKLGTGHPAVQASPGRHPSLAGSSGKAASSPRARRYHVVLDTAALSIDQGVPLPEKQAARRPTDWPSLFARMQPGDSVLLPRQVRATLGKAVSHHHRENDGVELATRVVDDDHIRLWKVK